MIDTTPVKKTQLRGKLHIANYEDEIITLQCSGELFIMKPDEYLQIERQRNTLLEDMQHLKSQLKEQQQQMFSFLVQIDKLEKQLVKTTGKLERFEKNKGKGRPLVLTPSIKNTICNLMKSQYKNNGKINISQIHKLLTEDTDFSGNYETVRKFISENRSKIV